MKREDSPAPGGPNVDTEELSGLLFLGPSSRLARDSQRALRKYRNTLFPMLVRDHSTHGRSFAGR